MKICVYAICKNEVEFLARWLKSVREADYICLLDTGSTDGTVEAARAWSAEHENRPVVIGQRAYEPWQTLEEYDAIVRRGGRSWRFDTARNESMELIPADTDVCVCLDLDEILCPGWREALEAAWSPESTTGRYEYVWNFQPDGSDGVRFFGEKVHRYGGCRWAGPVHEVLRCDGERRDAMIPGLRVEHHADDGKSRSSYLPMLELAVREDPDNDRNVHYLGREYCFRGQWDKAVETLKKHLALPTARWAEERAASMRYIARSLEALGDADGAELWLRRAVDEAAGLREPLTDLAGLCLRRGDWRGTVRWCGQALDIRQRPMTYMTEPGAWGALPWDLLSVAWWNLGQREYAVNCCRKAAELAPADERIRENLKRMEETT